MKEIFLDKKWVGAIALVVYSLIIAVLFTGMGVKLVENGAPVVEKEINEFLPITIADGAIVAPQDALISKVYGDSRVVLDTRADEFETSALKDKGLYISRKYIYAVSKDKTEIRGIDNFPNMTIDEEVMSGVFKIIHERAGVYIFFTLFISFIIFFACAIGLYTLVMYWPLKALYHNEFGQVLRINTFAYIVISALTLLLGFSLSIIITFVLMFGANCGVNEGLKKIAAK